ncbi:hypothetical protein [Dongia sp.]|uniref:hypothetical protein n=1 Tax=Dongia sp. TaxID=1977262 RepID=UPI0037529016
MTLRAPSRWEIALQALLLLALLYFTVDLWQAHFGQGCETVDAFMQGGCYPWGWEGAFAELRILRSQENYLTGGWVRVVLLATGLAMPFLLQRRGASAGFMAISGLAATIVVGNWPGSIL